jgi:hypothetical protein
MNTLKRCAIYLSLAGSVISAQAPKAPITISISGPTAPVKAGERFPIAILVTNISNKTMVLGRVQGGLDVGFRDYQGFISYRATSDALVQIVPPTQHPLPNMMVSSQSVWLEPEQSFTDTLHISDVYDMSKPGIYSFRLIRKARKDLGDIGYEEIPSNAIDIVVVE